MISPDIPKVTLYVHACYAKFLQLHPPLNNGRETGCCPLGKVELKFAEELESFRDSLQDKNFNNKICTLGMKTF